MSIETSQTEMQRENRMKKKNGIEYPGTGTMMESVVYT